MTRCRVSGQDNVFEAGSKRPCTVDYAVGKRADPAVPCVVQLGIRVPVVAREKRGAVGAGPTFSVCQRTRRRVHGPGPPRRADLAPLKHAARPIQERPRISPAVKNRIGPQSVVNLAWDIGHPWVVPDEPSHRMIPVPPLGQEPVGRGGTADVSGDRRSSLWRCFGLGVPC